MGMITYGLYKRIYNIVGSNALAVLAGIFTYAVVMVLLKAFTKDEIMILQNMTK